jgi:single-stranded-DNA-specific exonuclease
VISRHGEEAFGSGRSIKSFHLLDAIESCSHLFSRHGGHAHACGFALPSANIAELRAHLDAHARARLTPADFDPVLDLDAELNLSAITPSLFQALRLLEPYGVGNLEPVFAARAELIAPPRILKEKHMKLKVRAAARQEEMPAPETAPELSAEAVLVTPNCHPDGAAIRRSERTAAIGQLKTENRELRTVIGALGWRMAERIQQTPLLAGDTIDIAFTIGHNDHPEYGGLELTLRDFKTKFSQDKGENPSPKVAAAVH